VNLVELLRLPVSPAQLEDTAGHKQQVVVIVKLGDIAHLASGIAFFAPQDSIPLLLAFLNAWNVLRVPLAAATLEQQVVQIAPWDIGAYLAPNVALHAPSVSSWMRTRHVALVHPGLSASKVPQAALFAHLVPGVMLVQRSASNAPRVVTSQKQQVFVKIVLEVNSAHWLPLHVRFVRSAM